MNLNVPARQIFLDDAISRHKTGFSPIREKQSIAQKYTYIRSAFNFLVCSAAVSGFFSINKLYTGRKVYFLVFLGSSVASSIMFYVKKNYKSITLKKLDCKEELFDEYLWFYRNAVTDHPNYFEEDRQKH